MNLIEELECEELSNIITEELCKILSGVRNTIICAYNSIKLKNNLVILIRDNTKSNSGSDTHSIWLFVEIDNNYIDIDKLFSIKYPIILDSMEDPIYINIIKELNLLTYDYIINLYEENLLRIL